MSLLGLWYTAQFINPNKPTSKYQTFTEIRRERKERERKQLEKELKIVERREKERAREEERRRKEQARIDREIEKQRQAEYKYQLNHNSLVEREINPVMTLCLVDGMFTSRGIEIKAFVSVDDRDGEPFTIRAEIGYKESLKSLTQKERDKSVKVIRFEYLGEMYELDNEEIMLLFNKKDTREIEEEIWN